MSEVVGRSAPGTSEMGGMVLSVDVFYEVEATSPGA
jgi:hypothetical protein